MTMPEEIVPGLFRLSIPLLHDSLGSVNTYAVMSDDGLRLIDCGWDSPEAYTALANELQQLGMLVSNIRDVLVTHNHPDHIGLTERLVKVVRNPYCFSADEIGAYFFTNLALDCTNGPAW